MEPAAQDATPVATTTEGTETMDRDYRECHLIGGREDGTTVSLQLSHFPNGSIYATRPSRAHPEHLALYRGDMPFDERMPVLEFQGWEPKDLSTASTTEHDHG